MAPKLGSTSLGPILGLVAGVAVGSVGTLLLTSRRVVQAVTSRRPLWSRDALADDSFIINPALSQVFLVDDARFPGWLILVPRRTGLAEVVDLTEEGQQVLLKEVASASRVLQRVFEPNKLNVSAIGNQTRQLHVHVSARNPNDAAWPGVHLNAPASGRSYFAPDELQQHRRNLIRALQDEVSEFAAEDD